ncbi:MAG: tetratricopeptide repeat protein, partial [Candidatus Zixiibacteriota bacterium]
AALVGILAWLLRARAPLLGDGFMRAADAASGARVLPSELLPSFLSHFLASGLPPGWRMGGQDALRALSVVAGVLLVVGLWWLAPKADPRGGRRLVFWVLTFGAARLFAGYVESYALPVAISVLWILALLAYRRGPVSSLPVIALSLLAVASHATTAVFIPVTLWVFWNSRVTSARRFDLPIYAVIVAVGLFMLADRVHATQVDAIGLGLRDFLLPLLAQPPHWYGILTPAHLIDGVNQVLILTPALLVALALKLASRAVKQPVSDQGPQQGEIGAAFWVLAILLPILAGLLLDPKLGWARDWDLFAVIYSPLMVGAAVYLARIPRGPSRRAIAGVALLSAGLWLSFSADAASEVRRYEALLRLDRSRADYGHEILALYYRDTGRPMGEIMQYKEALKITDNARYHVALGNAFSNLGRQEDAAAWYRSGSERDPDFHEAHYGLAVTLANLGRFDEALPHAQRAVILNPNRPEYQYQLGYLLMRKGMFAEALPHLERGANVLPRSARNLNSLGVCYTEVGRLTEARASLDSAMIADPSYSPAYLNAARIELTRANTAEVRRLLTEYERLVPIEQRVPLSTMIADSLSRLDKMPSP